MRFFLNFLPIFLSCAIFAAEKIPVGVVVDAYGTANNYASSIRAKGLEPVHVQSSKELLPVFKNAFNSTLYLKTLAYEGDIEEVTKKLQEYDVRFVIAGVEPGVELADLLSEKLNLCSNGSAFSKARRDKYVMDKVLFDAKIPVPKFCKLSAWEELLSWRHLQAVDCPIVLKPLNSGGTDGVYICEDEDSLIRAFNQLLGSVNVLGFKNQEILAQSFLKGQEYIVNSVSLNGVDKIVALLLGQKRQIAQQGFIYDREVMLSGESCEEQQLIEMHKKILRALHIDNGPAHGEYIFTENGPVLVEIAARISGGVNTKANTLSVGYNQIDLTVDAYTDPEKFNKAADEKYQLIQHSCQILLSAEQNGKIKSTEEFNVALRKLSSYCDSSLKVKTGQIVSATIDLISSLGSVFLVHPDREQLDADYREVLRLSRQYLTE